MKFEMIIMEYALIKSPDEKRIALPVSNNIITLLVSV